VEQDSYTFAHLDKREDLLQNIKQLETVLKRELGEEVTLIAYTPKQEEG
jgi:hypothetical protein